jgi:pyruvate-ferredoxin/flavodoxin oxidoreductase
MYKEGRFRMLTKSHPERAAKLLELAKADVAAQWETYSTLANKNGK